MYNRGREQQFVRRSIMRRYDAVRCALAVLALAAMPAWSGAQDAADVEVQRLIERAAKADKSEALRQDVMAFQRKYLGTSAAVKAAGLLRDLPSPLDKLDAKAIPELERFDWHPKETVAVLGEHRGRQAGPLTCVVFSRHGKWLASGSTNHLVRIWDPATMRLKHTVGHTYGAYCLAVSKDSGLLVVGGGDGQVSLWDMTGDAPKRKEKDGLLKVCSTPLLGIALAPNGNTFVCGGSDSRVYLWDITADPPKEESGGGGHAGAVHAVVYSPSGKLVASGGADKSIKLWTLTDKNRLEKKLSAETPAGILCLAFHPKDEKTLVSGSADGTIQVWEVGAKMTPKAALKTKNGAVNAITFSATGNTIAAAFSDGTARTWGFGAKLTEKATLEGHKAAATCIAFSTDGAHIATGGADWTVRLWPGVSGVKPRDKTIVKGHLSHVYNVAFHPDGAGLASGSYDTTVRLWDLAATEPKERISKLKEEGAIYTLAFAPDGKTLAAGGATAMFRTCDFATGGFLFGFKGHAGQISRLAWSPDGKHLASCSNDKSLRVWEGLTGKGTGAVTTFEAPVNSVAYSPSGKQLACISGTYLYDKLNQIVVKNSEYYYNDSTVRLYEAGDLKEVTRWKFDTRLMSAVAYTPDGRNILAGGSDQLLRQWDAIKLPKEPEVIYKWGTGGLSVLNCSPDGRWVVGYGPDYRIQLLDLETRKKVKEWAPGEQFGHVAFAPDSRHLAISVATGVVLVLRLEGPKQGG
jgi:WD40 repeat protein